MAEVRVRFATDNDAFRDPEGAPIVEALGEILKQAARRVSMTGLGQGETKEIPLRDGNGNRIGEITIVEDLPEAEDLCWDCDCGGCTWASTDCCELRPFCETGSDGNVVVCSLGKGCSA